MTDHHYWTDTLELTQVKGLTLVINVANLFPPHQASTHISEYIVEKSHINAWFALRGNEIIFRTNCINAKLFNSWTFHLDLQLQATCTITK